jgi:tRNA 2-thiouridine synthesizing protein E
MHDIDLRHRELAAQRCDRTTSKILADAEGIAFSDEHWEVIVFLRSYYLEHGLRINARTTAKALNRHFYHQGGRRLANLRTPAFATDASFGTSY